ncbi:alginate O-acetyltransferase AlgX-related protein [Deinococcus oregonensis]
MLPSPPSAKVRSKTLFGVCLLLVLVSGLCTAFWTSTARQWPAASFWQDGRGFRTLEQHFERHLLLHDPAVQSWNALRFAFFKEAHPAVLVGNRGWLFLAEEFRVDPQAAQQTQQHLREIKQVQNQLQTVGASLVVVLIPAKAATYPDQLARFVLPEAVQTRYAASRQALGERGLAVVNLPPVFQAARSAREVFWHTDLHWTPYGAAQAAEATAQVVQQAFPDVTLPKTRFKTVFAKPHVFNGDLLRYLDFGPWQVQLWPPSEQLTEATTVAVDTSLLGESSVPVALIGTSFSADPVWNFAGFLREALSAQVLNAAQDGLSPFEAMTRYLNSSEFSAQPPQLVVWEIPERYLSTPSSVRGVR